MKSTLYVCPSSEWAMLTLKAGLSYGKLPVPTRSREKFLCWDFKDSSYEDELKARELGDFLGKSNVCYTKFLVMSNG